MRLYVFDHGTRRAIDTAEPDFADSYDVVVCGLGTAGAIAAIAAGRAGQRVLGVEQQSYPGGVGTGGGIHSYYHGTEGGIQAEVDSAVRACKREGFTAARGFHPDAKKLVLERLLSEAGVEFAYRHRPLGVWLDGRRIAGLRLIGEDGLRDVACACAIDSSGDADIAALAGAPFRLGRELDGKPQPYSAPRGFIDERGAVAGANFDAGYVDPTDGADVSRAIVHGHRLHLAERFSGEQRVLYFASLLGFREGRLIEGVDELRYHDLLEQTPAKRPVFTARAHHDTHSRDWSFESEVSQDWMLVCGLWSRQLEAQVPYGALVSPALDNLLVAGRCIAIDHDASQTVRMQRDMQKLGEVAGRAAALANDGDCAVNDIPYETLAAQLRASGCLQDDLVPDQWLDDVAEIRAALSGEAPGIALWSCRRLGEGIAEQLREWLGSDERELRRNAALALGMLGDTSAAAELRAIVAEPDRSVNQTYRNRQPERVHGAAYLLGRLADPEAVAPLCALLGDDPQDCSHAAAALLKIGERHPDQRDALVQALAPLLGDPDWHLPMQLQVSNAGNAPEADLAPLLRAVASAAYRRWGREEDLPVDSLDGFDRHALAVAG